MYQIFFVNFWVKLLCPVYVYKTLKTKNPLKSKKKQKPIFL